MKPSIPKGTRDFSPAEMQRRNYIFETIKNVFLLHGFQQIETPAMENLSVLEGKYGEEGDKLLFRVFESGEFYEKSRAVVGIQDFEGLQLILYSLEKILFDSCVRINDNRTNDLSGTDPGSIINLLSTNSESIVFTNSLLRPDILQFVKIFFNDNLPKISEYLSTFFIKSGIEKNDFKDKFDDFRKNQIRRVIIYDWLLESVVQKYFSTDVTTRSLLKEISEKGLRYDLTVPFARYVVQHRNEIAFPFKRFQVQSVWRADKPQKGRYREFYQCDVDVIGSNSLLNEVELIQIIDKVFTQLKIPVTIKINSRKILQGFAEATGESDKIIDLTVAIDKLEKIGIEKVKNILSEKGFSNNAIVWIEQVLIQKGNTKEIFAVLENYFHTSIIGQLGISELRSIIQIVSDLKLQTTNLELDVSLARGLNYYTGIIIEVKANNVQIGSVAGGGRYDDLTGIFGLPNVSGVGISFGVDRIYDVMEELKLFDMLKTEQTSTQILFVNFGEKEELFCLQLVTELRNAGIAAELYPDRDKIKKQMSYANDRKIPFVALVGEEEMTSGKVKLKDMNSGEEKLVGKEQIAEMIGEK